MKTNKYSYEASVGLLPMAGDNKKNGTQLEVSEDKPGQELGNSSGMFYGGDSLEGTMEIERPVDDVAIITLTDDEYNELSGKTAKAAGVGEALEKMARIASNTSGDNSRTDNNSGGNGDLLPNKPNFLLIGGIGLMAFLLLKK